MCQTFSFISDSIVRIYVISVSLIADRYAFSEGNVINRLTKKTGGCCILLLFIMSIEFPKIVNFYSLYPPPHPRNPLIQLKRLLLMRHWGFEPQTTWLKVKCSTDWANVPKIQSHISVLNLYKTGLAGFEPATAAVKVLCLTAWR